MEKTRQDDTHRKPVASMTMASQFDGSEFNLAETVRPAQTGDRVLSARCHAPSTVFSGCAMRANRGSPSAVILRETTVFNCLEGP